MKSKPAIVFVLIFLVLSACQPDATPEATPTALIVLPTPAAPPTPVPSPTPLTPSALSARLSEITGKVEIKQAGQDAFTPVNADSFLDENGQVQTGDDGRARLDLSTGTIIRVAPASLFTLISNEPTEGSLKTSLELLLGKIFIILNGGSMEVQTPSGTAAVRGSYMSVSYDPNSGEVRITCLEGTCSLTSAGGSVEITAGQTAVVTGAGQPPQIGEMSEQDIQEWLDNNPEASLIVSALTEAPPAQVIPPVVPGPLVFVPPIKKKDPPEPKETPVIVPPVVIPPSLVPTVVINSISPSVSVIVGEPVTLIISVQPSPGGPTPTGTVKVLANEIPICTASLDTTGNAICIGGIPSAGSINLVADYAGDGNYLAAQSAAWGYAVNQAGTTTTIQSQIPNPSLVGTAVTFTATVDVLAPGAGTPFGSVTFYDSLVPTDYCTINFAPWTCNITFTISGIRSVIAIFTSSDTNFSNSDNSISPASQTVNP